jgi:HPt (histidine-containing phosphotransfer) domain-containing protein
VGEGMYIDEVEGVGRVMNNRKLYAKLLTKFRNENSTDAIMTALQAENYEQAAIEVHKIKGVSANLSLTELFEQSKSLESQIKGTSVNPDTVEAFKHCFAETMHSIDEVLSRYA